MDSTRESTPPRRNRPLARSARRYKGVIGESKEGIGGTRNPPCPPWPPEAPKIKGKRIDYHLRNPTARKNRTLELRRIQECNERTLKDPPRKNILSPTLHVPQLSPPTKSKNARASIMQTRGQKNFLLLHLQYKLRHKKTPATTYPARRLPAKYFRRDEA